MESAPRSAATDRTRRGSRAGSAALIVYFDTSAVVKLLLDEEGSAIADEVWSRASWRLASRLVYPETRAALAAAQRARRIDARGLRTAVGDLDAACAALRRIGTDEALAREAGELAERHALRGYDAVHLATALSVDAPELALLTWDGDLARAAVKVGLAVIPGVR